MGTLKLAVRKITLNANTPGMVMAEFSEHSWLSSAYTVYSYISPS